MTWDRPPLLLIAGWGFRSTVWDPLLSFLPSEWRATAIASLELVGQPDPVEALLVRIAAFPRPPAVVGWSLGALLAQACLDREAALAALAMIGGTPRFTQADGYPCGAPPAALRAMRRACRTDPAAVLRDFLAACATEPSDADALAPHAWPDAERLAAGLNCLESLDFRAVPAPRPPPTLILHGKLDRIVPVNAALALRRRFPAAELARLEGIGHDLPVTAARLCAGILAEFLTRAAR